MGQYVVFDSAIQLGNPLRSIGVGDAVLRTSKLFLDFGPSLLRLLLSGLALHDIWQLNNQIQLAGTVLLVHDVQQVELSLQPRERRIRLVHHRIEWILNDRNHALGEHQLFPIPGSVVVELHSNVAGIPLCNPAGAHGANIHRLRVVRIVGVFVLGAVCRVDRHCGDDALVQHRQHEVLDKRLARLVDVRLDVQAPVQAGVNGVDVPAVVVQPDVLNGHFGNVHRNAVVDRRNDRPLCPGIQNVPVRLHCITRTNSGSKFIRRVPVLEGVPRSLTRSLPPGNQVWGHSCTSYPL